MEERGVMGVGPDTALCVNPKCRKKFNIPANHRGRKPQLCPECKEAGVKVKDLDLDEKEDSTEQKPKRKVSQPTPVPTPEPQGNNYKLKRTEVVALVPKLREFDTDDAASAFLEGFFAGRRLN